MPDEVATENSLTLIKLPVAGIGLTDHDLAPLELGGVVEHLKYLGSLVE